MTGILPAVLLLGLAPPQAPIPPGPEIKARVLKSFRQSEDARENYSCTVHQQSDELNSDGTIKKHRSAVKEQFFVNGIQIEHTLERDGKPLSDSDARKEQERVDKKVKQFSNPDEAHKTQTHNEKRADQFLRALTLSNGRREQKNGRSTLLYDLAGDPAFHPRSLEERFAKALSGSIAVDESSAVPVELRFETNRDVKIGAGLLANLHKGFWLHLTQQRQPDNVWITREVEGTGDARAALFLHTRFRFREELEKCHLFSVKTHQTVSEPPPPKP